MKDIQKYIVESQNVSIKFNGEEFVLDKIIQSTVHANLDKARTVDTITDEMFKDLRKQGVKYVLCFPPHYYAGDVKNDVFDIRMFIKSKKMFNMYKNGEKYAIYDTKTGECVNKEKMDKGRAYKVIRYK
jgi:hypothetical protein